MTFLTKRKGKGDGDACENNNIEIRFKTLYILLSNTPYSQKPTKKRQPPKEMTKQQTLRMV